MNRNISLITIGFKLVFTIVFTVVGAGAAWADVTAAQAARQVKP